MDGASTEWLWMGQVHEHRYVDGRQHYGRGGLVRTCDTAVFVWQTPAAAAAWPVSPPLLRRLADAFRATAGPDTAGEGGGAPGGGVAVAGGKRPRVGAEAAAAASEPTAASAASAGGGSGEEAWVRRKAARRAEREVRRAQSDALRLQRRQARREQRETRKRKAAPGADPA